MTTSRLKTLLLISTFSLLVGACASKKQNEGVESTEQAYYVGARQAIDTGRYSQAIELLEELESRYPFGRYAEQAQLDLIYAHYRAFDYEAARASADRFIRLHPQSTQLAYAYYLRGLAAFEKNRGIVDSILSMDPSQRDPGAATEAIADFALLINRFPDSRYAEDARARIIYLRNLLAAHEIHVARYYLKRRAYVAAANRGRYVVENFQETPSVPDGLAVMVEAYRQLQLSELAEQSLAILALNHPDHPALGASGGFDISRSKAGSRRSWLNIATFGLLGKADENE